MIKVLFVCHGNICRSAMAEYIMKDLVRKAGLTQVHIESAATSSEEIGEPVYPPARRVLEQHGIACRGHAARRVTKADYGRFDYLIGMDRWNMDSLERLFSGDPAGKVYKMCAFGHFTGDVEDPWYTGAFEKVFEQLLDACEGLLERCKKACREGGDIV